MPKTIHPQASVTSQEEVCGKVSLANGQVVRVESKDGEVRLTPDLPLESYRGFLEGMKADDLRDKTDRF